MVELLRSALGQTGEVDVTIDDDTGLPIVRVGRPVTADDVRTLDDDDDDADVRTLRDDAEDPHDERAT